MSEHHHRESQVSGKLSEEVRLGAEEEEEQAKEKGGQTPTVGRSRGGRSWRGPRTDGGVARADVGSTSEAVLVREEGKR